MGVYIVVGVIVLVVLLLLGYIIKKRNNFVVMRNRIKDQQAQIDVQLKRRYDLIPNLIETAKGYACFEKSTLEAVAKARATALGAKSLDESMAANEQLTGMLHRILAVGESYPELKANSNFMQLQNELSATEDKIAKARQFFNDTVLKYNNAIQVFPASMVAGMCGFKEYQFLEAAESERESIKISSDTFQF